MQNENAAAPTIVRRLETLERQNRRLRVVVTALALGVAVVLVTAASPSTPDSVTARKFVLTDENGKTRAALMIDDGQPDLGFYDVSGRSRATFGIGKYGPRFALLDETGAEVVEGITVGNGGGDLTVAGGNGIGINLTADPRGSAFMNIASGPRRAGVLLSVGPYLEGPTGRDEPFFTLYDADGNERLTLGEATLTTKAAGGNTKTPVSTVTAFDKNGNVLGQWP